MKEFSSIFFVILLFGTLFTLAKYVKHPTQKNLNNVLIDAVTFLPDL